MFPEFAFRQVEPIFARVLSEYPETVTVAPPFGTKAVTFRNKLRTVLRELLYFRWPTSFDLTQLEALFKGDCVIRATPDEKVQIGPKLKKGEPITSGQYTGSGGFKNSLTYNNPISDRALRACLTLSQEGLIQDPIYLVWLQDATELEKIIADDFPSAILSPHPTKSGYLLW